MKTVKGYKATDKDGKCKGIKFTVGKVYTIKGELELCKNGFHFCEKLLDVYNYYTKDENTRIFEVEAIGNLKNEGDKSCTSKLKVLRELETKEIFGAVLKNTNSGDRNSGYSNSGHYNSGNWNSGNSNSGHYNSGNTNSGDRNSGNWNSGNWNSGNWNSGNRNSGYSNSGNWNSGNSNSGYFNKCNHNSGIFNTETKVYLFNKPSDLEYSPNLISKLNSINVKPIVTWIQSNDMTEQEKNNNPSHKVTGGFLRKTDRMNWNHLTEIDKEYIKSLPNFDDDVFEKISGIRLTIPKVIKVTVNGVEKEISYDDAKKLGLV